MSHEQGWNLHDGDEVVPRCTAIRKLGGGRAYEAYEAFDDRLLTPVVVKIVRPHLVADEPTLRGLRREVTLLGRLNHPVIVRGFHAATDGDRPYVALEYLPGPRLSTLLRKGGALPLNQLLPLAIDLCTGLHYMHDCGVVHIDVKPSNIIMDATPRLIDLSVARTIEQASALDHPVGTDRYMAPEQCAPQAGHGPGPAADIWGLGATLYEAAFGHRAFVDSPDESHPQVHDAPLPPAGSVPLPVVEPIMQCLSRDPGARPTAAELMTALAAPREQLPRPKIGFFRPKTRQ